MKSAVTLFAATLALTLQSCIKQDPQPDLSDYYKNKMLSLQIDQVDIGSADLAMIKIGAVTLNQGLTPRPRIAVNGEELSGDFITISRDMLEDGPVRVETLDSAWQFILEYNLNADASPYSLTFTPAFNGIAQDPINFYVDRALNGILEIKEYRP